MSENTHIAILTIWENNIIALNQKSPINLIKIYKKRKYKYAIAHYHTLKEYENIYPKDKSVTDKPKLEGITQTLMKRRIEHMNSTNPNY